MSNNNNNNNSRELRLQHEIQELQNTLQHLTLSCQHIKSDIEGRNQELTTLRRSQRVRSSTNSTGKRATGKKDRDKEPLFVGDYVQVLTKSYRPTAVFYGVKKAKIVRFDKDWIYLESIDKEESRPGKRIAYNLRKIK